MAVVRNIKKLVENGIKNSTTRTLILVDNFNRKPPVYCLFVAPIDQDDITVAKEFFNETYDKLQMSNGVDVFTTDVLPILNYVGRWKVTVITRKSANSYSIADAEHNPVDSHIGLG